MWWSLTRPENWSQASSLLTSLCSRTAIQKILSFDSFGGRGAGSEPPVKIILLIDTIGLSADLAHEERLAVETYLRQAGPQLALPVSVFLLADSGLWTLAHLSGDGNELARELEHNDVALVRHDRVWQSEPERGTENLKNIPSDLALKALAQIATAERKKPGRKLLLWVGPGWGIGSGAYADLAQSSPPVFDTVWWFSALLREARLVLYSFTVGEADPEGRIYKSYLAGVTSPHKATLMNLYRKVLAVQCGGRVMDDSPDLVHEIERCVEDTGPFYRISFDPFPADHPSEYHDLKVLVDQPGLDARTHTGYYDQPYYSVEPIPPPRRVSVEELEHLLASARGESDRELAKQFSELALTERLSGRRLASLAASISGKRAREELRILAASSTFWILRPMRFPPNLRRMPPRNSVCSR